MIKFIIIFLITSSLNLSKVCAQLINPFSISSIGSLNNTGNCNISAFFFQSTSNCLNVQSGLPVFFAKRNIGNFSNACNEVDILPHFQFLLYPNPVVESATLQLLIKPVYNEMFQIKIINVLGIVFQQTEVSVFEIFDGVQFDVSKLVCGEYILLIESDKFKDNIKFIKAK